MIITNEILHIDLHYRDEIYWRVRSPFWNSLRGTASMRTQRFRMVSTTSSFGRRGKCQPTRSCTRGWTASTLRRHAKNGFFTCLTKGTFASWKRHPHEDIVGKEDEWWRWRGVPRLLGFCSSIQEKSKFQEDYVNSFGFDFRTFVLIL